MKEGRRVPLKMLRRKLKVEEYEKETPFDPVEWKPRAVRLPFAQHVGKPATPIVKRGAAVKAGEPVAKVGERELGVTIHASIAGKVTEITDTDIEIGA
jgi:Na+-translocating ferredoxin:NAD+ oxidoreductase RnfC subunit